MVTLLTGASHTGKTLLSQRLIQRRPCFCLSLDHLKMGLIRSGYTSLTPEDDHLALTDYLWPSPGRWRRPPSKTARTCSWRAATSPFTWQRDFPPAYQEHLRFLCLVMTEDYLRANFSQVLAFENQGERRQRDPSYTLERALAENHFYLEGCRAQGLTLSSSAAAGWKTCLGKVLPPAFLLFWKKR